MAGTLTRPTVVPEWTRTGTRTDPGGAKQDTGWILGEKPPAEFFNWIDGYTGDWLAWIDERFFDGASVTELELDPGSLIRSKTTFEIDTGSTTLFEAKELGTRRTILTKRGSQTWILKDSGDVERGQVFWGTQAGTPGLTFKDETSLEQSDFALLPGGGFIWHAQGGVGLGPELMRLSPSAGGLFSIIVPVDITLPATGDAFTAGGSSSAFEISDDGTAIALIDNPTGSGFRFQEEVGFGADPVSGIFGTFLTQVRVQDTTDPVMQLLTTGGVNTTDARIVAQNTGAADGDVEFQIAAEVTPKGWTFNNVAGAKTPLIVGGGQAGTILEVNTDQVDYDFVARGATIADLLRVDASADTVNVGGNLLLAANKRIELGGTDITIEDLSGSLAMTTDGAIVLTYDDNSTGSETLQVLQAATPIFTFENNGDMTVEQAGSSLFMNPTGTTEITEIANTLIVQAQSGLQLTSTQSSVILTAQSVSGTGIINFNISAGSSLGFFGTVGSVDKFTLTSRLNQDQATIIPAALTTLANANYYRTAQSGSVTVNHIITTEWEGGACIRIRNDGTGNVTLAHNVASPPANSAAIFEGSAGADVLLGVDEMATLTYDDVDDLWYITSVNN